MNQRYWTVVELAGGYLVSYWADPTKYHKQYACSSWEDAMSVMAIQHEEGEDDGSSTDAGEDVGGRYTKSGEVFGWRPNIRAGGVLADSD